MCKGLFSLSEKTRSSWGYIHGIEVCRGAPLVTHMLFANDCFLFCRENKKDENIMFDVFKNKNEKTSGQLTFNL